MLDLFDYDALTPAVRDSVTEHTGEIRRLTRRAAEDIVEIGQRLKVVRDTLGYGAFEGWLKAEFNWSRRAAYNFIKVAEVFGCANFAQLDIAPSALYALAADSTPEFVRTEIIEMARATEQPVTHKAVQERITAHHAPAPELESELEQDAPPPPAVDNAPMPAKKKDKPVKAAPAPYVPLPTEYEEREHEDGSVHLYPKLPDSPKKLEIKQKDWDAATNRFENSAASALTALGHLRGYELADLQTLIETPEGRAKGAGARVRMLREAMRDLLERWDAMDGNTRTIDAPTLFELEQERKTITLN